MQCSKERVGLIDPEKPGANPALMHYAVKVILQPEKIDGVAAQVVEIIVIYPRTLKLETHCAKNLARLAIDDDLAINDVTK